MPKYDLLIAGFPCQTFSVIGQKAGFNDDRGQIIFQLIRLLDESRPKCFILENVKGLVTHDKGQTIKTIMKEFENIDYHVSYRVFTSLEHGVPQMRQRVYFVGFDKRSGLSGKGVSFWSVPKMAKKCNMCPTTCRNTLKSLEEKGYIDITQRFFENAQQSNIYTVHQI